MIENGLFPNCMLCSYNNLTCACCNLLTLVVCSALYCNDINVSFVTTNGDSADTLRIKWLTVRLSDWYLNIMC